MVVKKDDTGALNIPPLVFYMLLGAAGLGGAGGYGVLGPQLQKDAIELCFDNSQTALNVAAQHGQELLDLRNLVYDRTVQRYTSEDATRDWAEQKERDEAQDRRLRLLERHVDKEH
jgi:hypothetical protein